jgi:hypothetical protein
VRRVNDARRAEEYRRLARECLAAAGIAATASLRDALNVGAETLFRLPDEPDHESAIRSRPLLVRVMGADMVARTTICMSGSPLIATATLQRDEPSKGARFPTEACAALPFREDRTSYGVGNLGRDTPAVSSPHKWPSRPPRLTPSPRGGVHMKPRACPARGSFLAWSQQARKGPRTRGHGAESVRTSRGSSPRRRQPRLAALSAPIRFHATPP